MRSIKMLYCTTVFAMAGMASGSVSSAVAEHTALCKMSEALCASGNLVKTVHFVSGIIQLKGQVFGVEVTILCLSSLISGNVESPYLAEPLGIEVTQLTFSNCGTNAAHNNCTVTTLTPGLIDILKTAGNLGTVIFLNTVVLKFCNLGILGNIHCDFGGPEIKGLTFASALHSGAGHGIINALTVKKPLVQALSGACPTTNTMLGTYESLEHIYLSS